MNDPGKKRRWRPGLLGRFVAALAAVALIPLAALAWPLFRLNAEAMQDQVLRTNLVAASTAAARAADLVASRTAIARTAAESPLVATAPLSAEAQDFLAGLLTADSHAVALQVLDDAGGEVVRVQHPGGGAAVAIIEAAPPAPPAPDSEKGAPRIVANPEGGAESAGWLVVELPLADALGTLRGVWDAALLAPAVEPFAAGEQVALVLADATGPLAGSGEELERLPPALIEQASSARLAGAGRFEAADGEAVLAAYDTVPGTGWYVVSAQPLAAAESVARNMRLGAWGALALALLLTGALSVAAWGGLVRPLRELVATQRRMAGLSGRPASGNEIEQLRDSFAALERSLRDRQAVEEVFLGRYRVLEVLGEGGMGLVFRGWDPRLERPVALKTLRLADDVPRREEGGRLIGEAVLAARINHPNAVAVYDVEDTPEFAFLAMEFVDGLSLDALARRVRLTSAEVAWVGAAVARALAAAHRGGVVHRDVKPGNVLLGRDGTVKVTDFGIAALMSSLAEKDNLIFGTPGYVSPEVLRGRPPSAASDLFALGVVLYQVLVGNAPFAGMTGRERMLDTLKRQPPPPVELRPDVDPELSELVQALLEKDVADRMSDGDRVSVALVEVARRLEIDWTGVRVERAMKERWSDEESDEDQSRYLSTLDLRLGGG